jgi:hypothetical protein
MVRFVARADLSEVMASSINQPVAIRVAQTISTSNWQQSYGAPIVKSRVRGKV